MTTPNDNETPTTEEIVPTPITARERMLLAAAQWNHWDGLYKEEKKKMDHMHTLAKQELTPKGKYKRIWDKRIEEHSELLNTLCNKAAAAVQHFRSNGHDMEVENQPAAVAKVKETVDFVKVHICNPWRHTVSSIACIEPHDVSSLYRKRAKEANAFNAESNNGREKYEPLFYGLDDDGILPHGVCVVLDLSNTWARGEPLYATHRNYDKDGIPFDTKHRYHWHLKMTFSQSGSIVRAKVYCGYKYDEPFIYKRYGRTDVASADVLADNFGTDCYDNLNFAASGEQSVDDALAFAHEIQLATMLYDIFRPIAANARSKYDYRFDPQDSITPVYESNKAECDALLKQFGDRVDASAPAE